MMEIIDLLVNRHNLQLISLLYRHLCLVYVQEQHKSWAWSTSSPSFEGPKDSWTCKYTGVCCSWDAILSCTSIWVTSIYYILISEGIFSFWIIPWYFSSIFIKYRYVADEQNQLKLQINAQNCLHCKVIFLKDSLTIVVKLYAQDIAFFVHVHIIKKWYSLYLIYLFLLYTSINMHTSSE